MPSSPNYKRNYREEYDRYHASSKQKKRRAQRNGARSTAVRKGKARLGDGKDVDHVTNDTASKKVRVVSKSTNRSFPRNKDGSVKKGKSKGKKSP